MLSEGQKPFKKLGFLLFLDGGQEKKTRVHHHHLGKKEGIRKGGMKKGNGNLKASHKAGQQVARRERYGLH